MASLGKASSLIAPHLQFSSAVVEIPPSSSGAVKDRPGSLDITLAGRPEVPSPNVIARQNSLKENFLGKSTTYTANVTVKTVNGQKVLHTIAGDSVVKSLINYVLAKEAKSGNTHEQGLLDLFEDGVKTPISFSMEVKPMYDKVAELFSPEKVSLKTSKNSAVLEETEVEENAVITALYDALEAGAQAFGPNALIEIEGDAEEGGAPKQVSVHEYLSTAKPVITSGNGAVKERIEEGLNGDTEVKASLAATLLLGMAQKQKMTLRKWGGLALSLGVSAGIGSLYEFEIGRKLKELFSNGISPEHLSIVKKFASVLIDSIPPAPIEMIDTFAALLVKSDAEEVNYREKAQDAMVAGLISLGMSIPSNILEYIDPESLNPQLKALLGGGAVAADLLQVTGAVSGVPIELRDQYAQSKAVINDLVAGGVLAAPQEGKTQKSHVEEKARQWMNRNPETRAAQGAVFLGILVSVVAAALGSRVADVVSDDAMRPTKSAVFQPFEAIGMTALTLLAIYVGFGMKIFTNNKQKVDQRLATVLDRHANGEQLSVNDNRLIDKNVIPEAGRLVVAAMAYPLGKVIAGLDQLGIKNDTRVASRIPYEGTLPEVPGVAALEAQNLSDAVVIADVAPAVGGVVEELTGALS